MEALRARLPPELTSPFTFASAAVCQGRQRPGYTITVQCTDASGNVAMKTVTVTVPHDQGGGGDDQGGGNGGGDQGNGHGNGRGRGHRGGEDSVRLQ